VSKVERDRRHTYTEPVDAVSRRTFLRLLPVGLLLGKIKTALPADFFPAGSPQDGHAASADGSLFGLYRAAQNQYLGIDRFMADTGESEVLMSDYSSGVVRRLSQVSKDEFTMGPAFTVVSPVEVTVRFRKDERGNITGVSLQPASGSETFAERVFLDEEQIAFQDGSAKLAGTLLLPPSQLPHGCAHSRLLRSIPSLLCVARLGGTNLRQTRRRSVNGNTIGWNHWSTTPTIGCVLPR
jgi:hypothetical protein